MSTQSSNAQLKSTRQWVHDYAARLLANGEEVRQTAIRELIAAEHGITASPNLVNDEIKKSGWPMSVIRAIRGATKLFIKRGKPENDRSLEKRDGQDKWIIKPGREDQFKNPRRNLTKRSGAGGDKSMKPKDDDMEG